MSRTGESLTPDSVSVTECHSHEHKGAAPRVSVTRVVMILMGREPRFNLASIGLIKTRGPAPLALPMALGSSRENQQCYHYPGYEFRNA